MKRIFGIMLLVCVVLFLTSCFNFGPTPDSENGVVKIRIRNPNYGISAAAIPVETDSFVVLIKGLSSSTPVVFKESFGTKEYIEFSVKLPGGKTYSFYFMGREGERITCFGSAKNVLVPSGESTELETQMKLINFFYEMKGYEANIRTFYEPPYGLDEARQVKWSEEYCLFKFTGAGLGDFSSEVSLVHKSISTGYEFDIWNGNQYYFRSGLALPWYISTGEFIPNIGISLKKFDANTIGAEIPIYFPLSYVDDSSSYEYEWGEFTFYVPITFGGERVIFKELILFSELVGDVQIVVE